MLNLYLLRNIVPTITRCGLKIFSFNVFYKLLSLLKIRLLNKEVLKKVRLFYKKKNFARKKKRKKKIIYIRAPLYFLFKVFRRLDPLFKTTVFYKSGIKYVFPVVSSLRLRCNMVMRWLFKYSFERNKELTLLSRLAIEFFETWHQKSSTYFYANDVKILIKENSRLLYLRRITKKYKRVRFTNIWNRENYPSRWFMFPYKKTKKVIYKNKKDKKYLVEYMSKNIILNNNFKKLVFNIQKLL